MKKRILSIVTCLAMVLSMLPTAAFAAEDTGPVSYTHLFAAQER